MPQESECGKYDANEEWQKGRESFSQLVAYTQKPANSYQASAPCINKLESAPLVKVGHKASSSRFVKGIELTAAIFKRLEKTTMGKTAWLDDNIIEAYLRISAPDRSFIINSSVAGKIFDGTGQHIMCASDFSLVDFVAAAVLVDDNHWNACFIVMGAREFYWLDPYGTSALCQSKFDNWCAFASSKGIQGQWRIQSVEFTRQERNDKANCGVYVCQYLKRMLLGNFELTFPNDKLALIAIRSQMSATLQSS